LGVRQHIVIPETQNLKPVGNHYVGPSEVVLASQIVLPAVEFDDQAEFETGEIGKIAGDWMLTAEAQPLQTTRAQVNVENLLDARYYGTSHGNNNIMPGAPRSIRASLAVTP
jgi:outer membrane receptor for Fe3+-dicitrate